MDNKQKIVLFSILFTIGWLIILGEMFIVNIPNETLEFMLFLMGVLAIIEGSIGLYKNSKRFKLFVKSLLEFI